MCYIAVKFRSIFSDFPFFNYVQSKALDDVSTKLAEKIHYSTCIPGGVWCSGFGLSLGPVLREELCGLCSHWIG